MREYLRLVFVLILFIASSCKQDMTIPVAHPGELTFNWNNASIYFLLTDRFYNGDPSNDHVHDEEVQPGPLRGFMGGDLKGITRKIKEGYFTDLGIDAIWLTPVVQQIEGWVDEGTGISFPFHGYWTKDWSAIDPRFGTEKDLEEMVQTAHAHGIRVLMDVVANHTGPVTPVDPQWPDEWVRTGPVCTYTGFKTTTTCTLVENLPDIRTENEEEVELPPFLIEKWKSEGRYEKEKEELDLWFIETSYPRTPVYYILKWLVDFVKKYGIDGFRVDTVKHTEPYVWKALYVAASKAFEDWKKANEKAKLDDTPFFMVGEVYGYYISSGRNYDFGDQVVDYFDHGFHALINFDFKLEAGDRYEDLFSKYDSLLHYAIPGKSAVNYISSHDDGRPYDLFREKPVQSATSLLLCPGGVQIYYGDETARTLTADAIGDATLRSFMNWDELEENSKKGNIATKEVLEHWQKLGKFRKNHPSVGAGKHFKIAENPYTFSRQYEQNGKWDKVVIALDANEGIKEISTGDVFKNNSRVKDAYSGIISKVIDGEVKLNTTYDMVLLEIY